MGFRQNSIAFYTLVHREWVRTLRIWASTLVAPVITVTLYFLIFGHVIGQRVGAIHGYPYLAFIVPGLIMMSVITNSYSCSVSALFSMKFQRDIEELLVTPMARWVMVSGFMVAGMIRGLLVGAIVTIVSLFFTHLSVHSLTAIIIVVLLSAAIFSLAGVLNALFAKTFDDIALIPTFVLTPLTYLGGVFYAISMLPPVWQYISMVNPIVYIMRTFRFGVLGLDYQNIWIAYTVMALIALVLFFVALVCFKRRIGTKL